MILLTLACISTNPRGDDSFFRLDSSCDERLHYVDADGDGFGDPEADFEHVCEGTSGYAVVGQDCNDADDGVNPDADETCDEVDQDCDGEVDEYASDREFYYLDEDGDGHAGDWAFSCEQPDNAIEAEAITDCDDSAPEVNPDATEICNEIDDDCDLAIDEGC
ncbi:MAG: hypothetical protein GY913_11075 [Proteobacteria bacterium]|nr:hypothetical protein [Pseudomonadota bacterium]MCP4917456.1 hypothetical protein [Pseudomonadota bacterium]